MMTTRTTLRSIPRTPDEEVRGRRKSKKAMSSKRKCEDKQTMTSNKKFKEPLFLNSLRQDIKAYFSKGGDKDASSKGEKSPSGDNPHGKRTTRLSPSSSEAGASTGRLPRNSNIGAREDILPAKLPIMIRRGQIKMATEKTKCDPQSLEQISHQNWPRPREQSCAGPNGSLRMIAEVTKRYQNLPRAKPLTFHPEESKTNGVALVVNRSPDGVQTQGRLRRGQRLETIRSVTRIARTL